MRLLVVEDDRTLRESLREQLTRAGFAVDLADNGIDGEFLGDQEPYDAVILDLGLPQRPGLEVLTNWRARRNNFPVIILTARDAWREKVDGFKAGADDYLTKPFHTEELIARINALIRRHHQVPHGPLTVHGLALDEGRQTVTQEGNEISLTATEFRVLRYLMLHPGKIVSKTELTEHVYEYDADKDSNVLEVYIKRLRQKLGKDFIETHRGQGYRFADTE